MSMVMLVLHTDCQSGCRTSFVLKYFHRKGQQSNGWRVSIILISDFLSPIRLQFRRRVRSRGLSASTSNLHTYMRLDSRSHQIHDIWSVKEILNRKLITISKTSVRRQVGLIISLYSDNGQHEVSERSLILDPSASSQQLVGGIITGKIRELSELF